MKKNGLAKVFAIFALVWIAVSVVWTWILVLVSSNEVTQQTFTQEELNDMIQISTWAVSSGSLDSEELISNWEVSTWTLEVSSWASVEEVISWTWELNN